MPYIDRKARKMIDKGMMPVTAGQLNYKITTEILKWLDGIKEDINSEINSYADYNEVMGVLECVKQELYRRVIAPYEDKKEEENGDVF